MNDRHPTAPGTAVSRACAPLALVVGLGLVFALALAGCAPNQHERDRQVFTRPLAALADSGQVEAMRVVADIEMLRAQGMFTDSLANVFTELPASDYMELDDQGRLRRVGRGVDLSTLVDYLAVEPQLLQELVITPEQAAELRRLTMDNTAAAAEMAAGFRGTPRDSIP